MMHRSNLLSLGVVFATLLAGSLISYSQVKSKQILSSVNQNWVLDRPVNIASLANSNYQFCSQPDPKDWRDGAGVCFNFNKTGNRVEGYYGYPHSDHFICIRGAVNGNCIIGEALAISWAGNQWENRPESLLKWDSEGRLTLSQGYLITTLDDNRDDIKWILYRNASLNVEGFYQYNRPRMTSPSQLCDWKAK
ncbi:hypothetical protein FNW02_30180 [Komarekiella sp. 'clone 1']|uniref:Uncharacterized protein n=2 Tax=Komarekiella TaxID=2022127 RepID=A0AA40T310_9NOST|nr:hypothetical protein [Komarekiella delphini-convector SJRDD-AB1]